MILFIVTVYKGLSHAFGKRSLSVQSSSAGSAGNYVRSVCSQWMSLADPQYKVNELLQKIKIFIIAMTHIMSEYFVNIHSNYFFKTFTITYSIFYLDITIIILKLIITIDLNLIE